MAHRRDWVPGDIFRLLTDRTPEDAFLDFKRVLFDPRMPREKIEEDKQDLARDFVAFANAQGGDIIIGIEDDEHRASGAAFLPGDQAEKIRTIARDIAISQVRPAASIEVHSLEVESGRFVVIARIAESQNKPHLWTRGDDMRFVIRDNDRKRTMAYEEIRELFLRGLQEERMARLLTEIEALRSLLQDLNSKFEKRG